MEDYRSISFSGNNIKLQHNFSTLQPVKYNLFWYFDDCMVASLQFAASLPNIHVRIQSHIDLNWNSPVKFLLSIGSNGMLAAVMTSDLDTWLHSKFSNYGWVCILAELQVNNY